MDPLLQLPSNLDRAHLERESSVRASGVRLQISSREYWRRKSEKDILEDRAEGLTHPEDLRIKFRQVGEKGGKVLPELSVL